MLVTATVSAIVGGELPTAAAAHVLFTDRLLRMFHGLFDQLDAAASGGLALPLANMLCVLPVAPTRWRASRRRG